MAGVEPPDVQHRLGDQADEHRQAARLLVHQGDEGVGRRAPDAAGDMRGDLLPTEVGEHIGEWCRDTWAPSEESPSGRGHGR
ncbi:MAG: hypothetical protein GEV28_20040 [Actinophytocola sp.]|uniref:hypothetical protein n=1 Tax=Actinophytocola sp. TaxID=1872138 RepID=UPI0013254AF8|nr:hypothetical protein [Actinophytocola sp.]MPZ82564.1 hypothetical protein [Actinophytocola sp.]